MAARQGSPPWFFRAKFAFGSRPTSRPDDEAGASTGAEHTPVCEYRSAATAQSAGRIVGRRYIEELA